MAKFVRVFNKDRNVVQLNIDQILFMWPKGSDFTARMIIRDVLGNTYLSLEQPDDFRAKIGAEK